MAEIKLEFVFVTTASEAIVSLPVVAVSPPNAQNLSAGPQARFGEGAHWIGCGPSHRMQT
jgi:hypothetical protein